MSNDNTSQPDPALDAALVQDLRESLPALNRARRFGDEIRAGAAADTIQRLLKDAAEMQEVLSKALQVLSDIPHNALRRVANGGLGNDLDADARLVLYWTNACEQAQKRCEAKRDLRKALTQCTDGPSCAASTTVPPYASAIGPESPMNAADKLEILSRPEVSRGWHLCGAGPARYGYAFRHPTGALTWLGSTSTEVKTRIAEGSLRIGTDGAPY